MGILRLFGAGDRAIRARNHQTVGTVTAVKTCWWLKINTRPVRAHGLDGAVFPHIISFTYQAGGASFRGSRYVPPSSPCPHAGEKITVFYDADHPRRYAVPL